MWNVLGVILASVFVADIIFAVSVAWYIYRKGSKR